MGVEMSRTAVIGDIRRYSSGSSWASTPTIVRKLPATSEVASSASRSLTARSEQAAAKRRVRVTSQVVRYPP